MESDHAIEKRKPVKNIVLCSDGTGNSGGKGNETNVWRIYKGIDLRSEVPEQVAYYDDGVGTQDFKYLKALSGGVGLGFSRNVREMYKFLVRAYEPGKDNRIYLFGFSRGAYTVRAFAAFVARCGIISGAESCSDHELDQLIKELVQDYHASNKRHAGEEGEPHLQTEVPVTPIAGVQFVGVWDTVSAVGVPFDFGFEAIVSKLFKFDFVNLKLSQKVRHARQALALDDERKSFHPLVWNETDEPACEPKQPPRIRQVWFAGVHSNVGGGYPKQGMSYEALDWMLDELRACEQNDAFGLKLEDGFAQDAHKKADVYDKLYDSRSGVAAYYRPKIRNVGRFTVESGMDQVHVHASAFRRISQKGRGYHPVSLPTDLNLVSVPPGNAFCTKANALQSERAIASAEITGEIRRRNAAHLALSLLTLTLVWAVLDSLITSSFAWLGCLLVSLAGLYLMESSAQKTIRWRTMVYVTGLFAIGAAIWAIWSVVPWQDLPDVMAYEWAVMPVVLVVIIASVGWKHFTNKQSKFAIPPSATETAEPQYKRVESACLAGVMSFVTLLVYADVRCNTFGWQSQGQWLGDAILFVLTPIIAVLPDALGCSLHDVIEKHSYWSAIGITALGTAYYLMRRSRRRISEIQERSWDIVRHHG